MKKYQFIVLRCAKKRKWRALVDSVRNGHTPPGRHRVTVCAKRKDFLSDFATRCFFTKDEALEMATEGNTWRKTGTYKVFRVERIA